MTATWGKVQNWAAEVEEEEAQNGGSLPVEEFPSLEASRTSQPKSKKKATKMGLGDFLSNASSSSAFRGANEKDILTSLPTASRGKTGDAPSGGLGGGFREYGRDREFGDGERERRPRQEDMGPSRADESDAWGKDRKFVPGGSSSSSFGGGGGGFDRSGRDRTESRDDGPSRADESDAWGRDKRYTPASRGGFEDRERGGFGDRDRGFGDRGGRMGRDRPEVDSDWGRGKSSGNGYGFDSSSSRDRGFVDGSSRVDSVDRWTRNKDEGSNSEVPSDHPSERPRLNLKPRSLPVSNSTPAASVTEAASQGLARKSNPFGNARPREEVLKEKGVDYKKEELKLEHDSALRPDTEEEEILKADIELLKARLEALSANDSTDPEEIGDLKMEIENKETHLLKLAAELDDRVKYSKDGSSREGSDRSYERGRDPNVPSGDKRAGDRRDFSSRSRDRFDEVKPAYGW